MGVWYSCRRCPPSTPLSLSYLMPPLHHTSLPPTTTTTQVYLLQTTFMFVSLLVLPTHMFCLPLLYFLCCVSPTLFSMFCFLSFIFYIVSPTLLSMFYRPSSTLHVLSPPPILSMICFFSFIFNVLSLLLYFLCSVPFLLFMFCLP